MGSNCVMLLALIWIGLGQHVCCTWAVGTDACLVFLNFVSVEGDAFIAGPSGQKYRGCWYRRVVSLSTVGKKGTCITVVLVIMSEKARLAFLSCRFKCKVFLYRWFICLSPTAFSFSSFFFLFWPERHFSMEIFSYQRLPWPLWVQWHQ